VLEPVLLYQCGLLLRRREVRRLFYGRKAPGAGSGAYLCARAV